MANDDWMSSIKQIGSSLPGFQAPPRPPSLIDAINKLNLPDEDKAVYLQMAAFMPPSPQQLNPIGEALGHGIAAGIQQKWGGGGPYVPMSGGGDAGKLSATQEAQAKFMAQLGEHVLKTNAQRRQQAQIGDILKGGGGGQTPVAAAAAPIAAGVDTRQDAQAPVGVGVDMPTNAVRGGQGGQQPPAGGIVGPPDPAAGGAPQGQLRTKYNPELAIYSQAQIQAMMAIDPERAKLMQQENKTYMEQTAQKFAQDPAAQEEIKRREAIGKGRGEAQAKIEGGRLEAERVIPSVSAILDKLGAIADDPKFATTAVGAYDNTQPFYVGPTVGAMRAAMPFMSNNGLQEHTDTRNALTGELDTLAAIMKPFVRGANEGPWTDKDQEYLVKLAAGGVLDANDAKGVKEIVNNLRERFERGFLMKHGLQMPQKAPATTQQPGQAQQPTTTVAPEQASAIQQRYQAAPPEQKAAIEQSLRDRGLDPATILGGR